MKRSAPPRAEGATGPPAKRAAAVGRPPPRARPSWPSRWLHDSFAYTEREHAAFARDGYRMFRQFLSCEALAYLRAAVDGVLARKHASVEDEWIMNLHQLLPRARNWPVNERSKMPRCTHGRCSHDTYRAR